MNIKNLYHKHRLWILLAFFVVILLAVFWIPLLTWPPAQKLFAEPEKIQEFILSYEQWAAVVFVVLSIVTIVAPPIPNEIVPMVGGMVFGFWEALALSLLARIIGSTVNFWIGRKIRDGLYTKLISRSDAEKLKGHTEKIGWQVVVISRFLPSTDTDLIAYIAGIAKMNYPVFILASFLGMLAPVSILIFMGHSLLIDKYLFFSLVAFYVAGILFAPAIIKKLFGKKMPVSS